MGAGIAVAMLDAGLPVTMIERDAESLARGRANVEKVYDGLVARKGRITAEAKAALMARFSGATSYDALAGVDLVVEAVFEDMAVKQAVFAELDRRLQAGRGARHQHLVPRHRRRSPPAPRARATCSGLHFFSPANIMKLLEIVVPAKVAADVGRDRLRAGEEAEEGRRCAPASATASSATASSRCTARRPTT